VPAWTRATLPYRDGARSLSQAWTRTSADTGRDRRALRVMSWRVMVYEGERREETHGCAARLSVRPLWRVLTLVRCPHFQKAR
jgi:hypothetical protein